MITKTVKIKNKDGLHARPATQLVKIASKFQSDVWLCKNGRDVNGKSIMGVMTLAAAKGSEILLKIDGPDENEAMEALVELFDRKFDEE